MPLASTKNVQVATTRKDLGLCYERLGQHILALNAYREALEILKTQQVTDDNIHITTLHRVISRITEPLLKPQTILSFLRPSLRTSTHETTNNVNHMMSKLASLTVSRTPRSLSFSLERMRPIFRRFIKFYN
jgi:tetratricopeptide (TPR) repeat protein